MRKYEELIGDGWTKKYRDYLHFKEKGLKKKAQTSVKEFIVDFQDQEKLVKRSFIDMINRLAFDNGNYSFFIPYNLYQEILKPEIEKWLQDEPENPIPYRWSYDLNLLKRALELNPNDQITLQLFGNMLIKKISMNQHEIAYGYPYSGSAQDDIDMIDFYNTYVDNIDSENDKNDLKDKLTELRKCANENI